MYDIVRYITFYAFHAQTSMVVKRFGQSKIARTSLWSMCLTEFSSMHGCLGSTQFNWAIVLCLTRKI